MTALAGRDVANERPLLRATLRVNTLIFCAMFGAISGLVFFALALASAAGGGHAPLLVALVGVFLPGYAPGWPGALAGLLWGFVVGAALAAAIYRIHGRAVLRRLDESVATERGGGDFPSAVLRLHGPSLGLALGATGAAGLIATTNWLVLRGTAGESVHARLLAHFLPGYAVDPAGSLVGAAELFVLLFVAGVALAAIYNRVADLRQKRR